MASRVETSNLSVISEDKTSARKYHDVADDCESIYTATKSKSAYAGGHKKKLHPLLLGPNRRDPGKYVGLHAASKSNLSEFTQRIMSAKLLKVKQVQNQLTETQIQLNELINENRILRNLQKRQEGALKKYEGNHAELPQLIRSHNEEIRTLKATNKIIKAQLRDANTKLKERENELENLRDNYNKLKKLSSEKNLMERDKLQKKVEEMQEVIKEQDEKIQVLSRKILLESKNYRHHLNIETSKHRETQKDLNNALAMINKLENQLLCRDKINWIPGGGPARLPIKNIHKSMPIITSKALENLANLNNVEDDYGDDFEAEGKTAPNDSPDTDSEILKNLMSSDDTPSPTPTPDIFPTINPTKKTSPEVTKSTEITASKSETFQLNCDMPGKNCSGLKNRKTPLPKKNSKITADLEISAKMISEKLSDEIQVIDKIVHEKTSNFSSPSNRRRLNSLYEEVKTSASKLETDLNNQITKNKGNLESVNLDMEEATKVRVTDVKRNVPKRKLEEEKEVSEEGEKPDQNLSESQQQKLISMAKTWNDIKDKIQEERLKAEEKMKELCKMKSDRENVIDDSSSGSDSESIENEKVIQKMADKVDVKVKKELENRKSFLENEIIVEEKKRHALDESHKRSIYSHGTRKNR